MPHLQEKPAEGKLDRGMKGGCNLSSGSDLPIREAEKGYLEATECLLTIKGMTASSSGSGAALRAVSDDTSCTPRPHGPKQSIITPSPYGSVECQRPKYGPIVTIFGNKRLVPSPIRVKRRVSQSEDEGDDEERSGSMEMGQPTNLGYMDAYSTPTKSALSHSVSESVDSDEPPKKRLLRQLEKDDSANTKPRSAQNQDSAMADHIASEKKPVISPAASDEKSEEDEAAAAASQGGYPPYGHLGMGYPPQYPPYPPSRHPYAAHSLGYGQPLYGGYPMYNGYPPPPPLTHFMGRQGGPQASYYPPYPGAHNPAMIHQYPRGVPGPHPFPGASTRQMMGRTVVPPPGEIPRTTPPSPQDPAIKSVADWRQAALSNGKPPSANRCVPLKEPIPSKYWGNAEKTKDAVLPDFHRLVNFPDYLVKSRNSSSADANQADAGKKNCVMCGKLRVCSAAGYVGRGRNAIKLAETAPSSSASAVGDGDCSAHIIPRQNKGLCTACDITVWVVVSDRLEIKWCKGCKNFRPWAAFGDKGSATKCVRCRDRQREKYAMQKDEVRHQKFKRTSSPADSSTESDTQSSSSSAEAADASNQLDAARGLRNLLNAASV